MTSSHEQEPYFDKYMEPNLLGLELLETTLMGLAQRAAKQFKIMSPDFGVPPGQDNAMIQFSLGVSDIPQPYKGEGKQVNVQPLGAPDSRPYLEKYHVSLGSDTLETYLRVDMLDDEGRFRNGASLRVNTLDQITVSLGSGKAQPIEDVYEKDPSFVGAEHVAMLEKVLDALEHHNMPEPDPSSSRLARLMKFFRPKQKP